MDAAATNVFTPGPSVFSPGQPMVTGEVDLRSLHQRLTDLGREQLSPTDLLKELGTIISTATGAHHVAWYGRLPYDDSPEVPLHILTSSLPEASDALNQVCLHLARDAAEQQAPCTKHLPKTSWAQLASVPVPHLPNQALVALFSTTPHGTAPSLLVLELAATRLALSWFERDTDLTRTTADRLATLTELLARLESASGLDVASQVLADSLQEHLRAERVVVGLVPREGTHCQITAVSGLDSFDTQEEWLQKAVAVLDESLARDTFTQWPALNETNRFALAAHRQFAENQRADSLLSLPLRTVDGTSVGAILIVCHESVFRDSATLAFLESACSPVASALMLQRRAERARYVTVLSEFWEWVLTRRGLAFATASLLAVGCLAVPYPLAIKCTCSVEPVVRRFVAAPFDGPLEKTSIEPGDLVTKGQILAKMDGKEVRWELAGVRAELQGAIKERAGHLANHDFGKAKVAEHEVSRLTVRTQLLEQRDANLELRSPIDGVVVSGDLTDSEGMPLKTGQTLFEIAPLDRMEVELHIPEADIAWVNREMPVRIWLDAFPHKKIASKLQSVHPRAEVIEDENVFVAEVALDRPDEWLRPGMHGSARIDAGRYPLGWVLFRRPWSAFLQWMGW